MLIEIHIIQNHSPANLNRDDLGAPKTCVFGDVIRARISSQCLKRSIRYPKNLNDVHNRGAGTFAKAMEGHMGTRTKFFPWQVEQALLQSSIPAADHRRIVLAAKSIGTTKDNDKSARRDKATADPRPKTAQLIFLGPGHAAYFVERLEQLRKHSRDCYDYFLSPVVGFQETVRTLLDDSGLEEKEQEKIAKMSWVIAKCRMEDLLKAQDGDILEKPALEDGQPGSEHAALIAKRMAEIFHGDKRQYTALTAKKSPGEKTQIKEDEPEKPSKMKEFMEALKGANRCDAVDIALFGRMTTSDAFKDVEAAMQVAHAISTHSVTNETDYWTAVDDLGESGGGAGHVGEALFNSACFYKYFSLNWNQLVRNLAGDEPEDAVKRNVWKDKIMPEVERLAAKTLGHFLRAAAMSTPSGTQNQHASHCLPDGILIVVKKDGGIPMSYANAFAQPVRKIGDPEDDTIDAVSLVGRSIAQFGDYVYSLRKAYPTNSTFLWFTPQLWRYPLQGWERGQDGEKKEAVAITSHNYHNLGGEGSTDGLVEAVVKEIGLDWHIVNGSNPVAGG